MINLTTASEKLLRTAFPLWQMNRPAKVLETWGLLGNATNLSVSIVFNGLWFLWVHAGMCVSLCVYPKKNECCEAITCLKWWPNYDSLLQHAALQNQTPWNWLPAHLDLICDSTFLALSCHWLSAGPCSFPTEQKINALKMHAYKIMEY